MTSMIASVFALGFGFWWYLNQNQCGTVQNLDFGKIEPQIISYTKTTYEVERKWIILGDKKGTHLSAFVYFPVTNDSYELIDLIPNKDWQEKHLEITRRKIGDTIAVRMATAKMKLAKNGKIPNQKFPVLLFGPGLGWLPTDYSSFLASMASKGYVVVAFSGIPISKTIYYPDNTYESTEKVKADYQKMSDYFDIAVTHIVSSKPESENHFLSTIDTSQIYIGGHSIAGAAALMAANKSQKIKGVINLDGDVTNEFENVKPLQPILYITTQPQGVDNPDVQTWSDDRSENRRDNAFVNNASRSQKSIRIKIPKMYHLDFLDVAQFKESICKECNRKSFGSIAYQKSTQLIQNAIFDFIQNQNNWQKLSEINNVSIQVK